MPVAARTLNQLREVLASYGVRNAEIHDIRTGRVNKHWRVEARDRRFALRRYTRQRTLTAIDYEHDALRHMDRLGWPVAVALPSRNGATTVTVDGHTYALFPFLPGRRLAPRGTPYYLRLKGTLLARLHAAIATYPAPRPRDLIGRMTDLDDWVPGDYTFDQVLKDYAREQPRLAAELLRWRNKSIDELERLGYHDLPDVLIHGDFHANNLFFIRRRLTGIIDFDFVRPDKRLADLALAIALAPPAHLTLDPDAVAALLAAYHAVTPLTANELHLIVPAIRAYYVWLCSWSILRWLGGEPQAAYGPTRTLDHRLPNLETRASVIDSAVYAALNIEISV